MRRPTPLLSAQPLNAVKVHAQIFRLVNHPDASESLQPMPPYDDLVDTMGTYLSSSLCHDFRAKLTSSVCT